MYPASGRRQSPNLNPEAFVLCLWGTCPFICGLWMLCRGAWCLGTCLSGSSEIIQLTQAGRWEGKRVICWTHLLGCRTALSRARAGLCLSLKEAPLGCNEEVWFCSQGQNVAPRGRRAPGGVQPVSGGRQQPSAGL